MTKLIPSIPASIYEVKQNLMSTFSECNDFIIRDLELSTGTNIKINASVAFIEGLVNTDLLNRDVITPLLNNNYNNEKLSIGTMKKHLFLGQIIEETDFNNVIQSILVGSAAIFVDGESSCAIVNISETPGRQISEPHTEISIRGPREGFVEKGETNVSIIRIKICNPNFKVEAMKIGKQTNTQIYICYIKGIANNEIIETVKQRLKKIDTDAILESGYIEQFIEDEPFSMFPTIGNSEKPDKVTAKLLEGRVAIVCDGTPLVLTVPYLIVEAIQASEDYYEKFHYSTIVRILRIAALFIATWLPAIYVSLISFNQSIIPFKLLLTMSASREGIPFSPFLEAVIMLITFELLHEAGIRMPRPLGQTIGIIGAIVLGEAAVRAGFVSSPMIMVVSLTGVCSFISPPLTRVCAIARILMLIAANILGLLGVVVVYVAIFIHLCTIRSFGVPYLSPISPINFTDLKDTAIRFPIWSLVTRPRVLIWDNNNLKHRMKNSKPQKED
jgi:spore germination protein KA